MTTKVHAICDGCGNPLKFILTAGNVNDSTVAEKVLSMVDLKGKYVLADKGYDSENIVKYIEKNGGKAVIPSRRNAVNPRITDWFLYKERHLIENLFQKAKNFKRFATRYEKSALSFSAVVYLAFILIWLH